MTKKKKIILIAIPVLIITLIGVITNILGEYDNSTTVVAPKKDEFSRTEENQGMASYLADYKIGYRMSCVIEAVETDGESYTVEARFDDNKENFSVSNVIIQGSHTDIQKIGRMIYMWPTTKGEPKQGKQMLVTDAYYSVIQERLRFDYLDPQKSVFKCTHQNGYNEIQSLPLVDWDDV